MLYLAKHLSVPIFLVGHVTKEGFIAGPKVLEHMVDTVLYIEGEATHAFRILRAVKNRFGSTNEIGVFEMKDSGLAEVVSPSEFFLSERAQPTSGSVVMPSLEGSRPILIELQALVVPTSFGIPRRTAEGIDANRVSLLVAVMEKRLGVHLNNQDIFLNIAGGMRVEEPAADLGVIAAIASNFRDKVVADSGRPRTRRLAVAPLDRNGRRRGLLVREQLCAVLLDARRGERRDSARDARRPGATRDRGLRRDLVDRADRRAHRRRERRGPRQLRARQHCGRPRRRRDQSDRQHHGYRQQHSSNPAHRERSPLLAIWYAMST